MSDDADLKRLRMRSWRRGIKEMDLILGPWADEKLATLDQEERTLYEAFLSENDHDLYQWVTSRIGKNTGQKDTGQPMGPTVYAPLLDVIDRRACCKPFCWLNATGNHKKRPGPVTRPFHCLMQD